MEDLCQSICIVSFFFPTVYLRWLIHHGGQSKWIAGEGFNHWFVWQCIIKWCKTTSANPVLNLILIGCN